jgi:hypothetical protein
MLWYPSSRVQTWLKSLDFSGILKILHMPSFGGEVKGSVPCPSFAACKRTWYLRELRCASKIPCLVPSFASRGLSYLCGAWRLWRWMRGTHWGKGTIGLQSAVPERPHMRPLTFFLICHLNYRTEVCNLVQKSINKKITSEDHVELWSFCGKLSWSGNVRHFAVIHKDTCTKHSCSLVITVWNSITFCWTVSICLRYTSYTRNFGIWPCLFHQVTVTQILVHQGAQDKLISITRYQISSPKVWDKGWFIVYYAGHCISSEVI